MRAWQPERSSRGPLPVTERDIPALNRLFADAFTDRYRRDGLVGVRVPFLNPAIWRYALADAGEGAMLWRDEADRVVAFNIAHRSGTEAWMGPLAVRPDRQSGGLGKEIVTAAVEWLKSSKATTIGLETMPRTVDNIGFYSRLGFVPGQLTLTMTLEAVTALPARGRYGLVGTLDPGSQRERLDEMARLAGDLVPGCDFRREIDLTLSLALGDVVYVAPEGRLAAFALCHTAPLADGGAREELRVLKLAAVGVKAMVAVLDAAASWASGHGIRRVAVRCQTAYGDAYRVLVRRGFRVRWSDLRMTLAGYPEVVPAEGIVWSNWEI